MNISLLTFDELRLIFNAFRSPVYTTDVGAFAATCVVFNSVVRENRRTLVDEHCEVNAFCRRFPMLPPLPNSRKKVLSVDERNKWWSWGERAETSLSTREMTTIAKIWSSGVVGECELELLCFYNVEVSGPDTSILAAAGGVLEKIDELLFDKYMLDYAAMSTWVRMCASGALPVLKNFLVLEIIFGDILCAALAGACDCGAFEEVRCLTLTDAFIGDTGLESLADAFARGAFGLVSDLDLACNRYGDAGCTALANALNSGALGSLETLCMDDGPDGTEHPKLRAACDERCIALKLIW